jgi:hypothetical protein
MVLSSLIAFRSPKGKDSFNALANFQIPISFCEAVATIGLINRLFSFTSVVVNDLCQFVIQTIDL